MEYNLKQFEDLTDKELMDVAYLSASHSDTPQDIGDLLVALIDRATKNLRARDVILATLPGMNAIIECMERTLKDD